MSEEQKHIYVGGGMERNNGAFSIDIDLDDFSAALKEPRVKESLREWTDKTGRVHRVAKLYLAPMKPENQKKFKTHSLKMDTWKPDPSKRREEPVETRTVPAAMDNGVQEIGEEDLPF